jgi:glutaredoxin
VSLVLYGRPGCHLCDEAREVLERIGEPFAEVDIETDDALLSRYLERIPVVALDEAELYDFFVDESDLRRRLDLRGGGGGHVAAEGGSPPAGGRTGYSP